MDDEPELSQQDAALMFLFWQELGDRALAGWTPYPPAHRPRLEDKEALRIWIRRKLQRVMRE